jgi:DnaK suppressor protein
MPLTSRQRDVLKQRLLEERARALAMLNRGLSEEAGASEQDRAGDLSVVPLHPADLGTDTMDAEMEAANETRLSSELSEIDAALDRLYSAPEQFGTCEETGEPIPFDRLQIIPWARTCAQASKTT